MTEREAIESFISKADNEGDMLYTLRNWSFSFPHALQIKADLFTAAALDFEAALDETCEHLGINKEDFEGY